MPIEVPDLTTLDTAEVQQAVDLIAQRVTELMPSVETRRGVIRGIVLQLAGALTAANARVVDEVGKAASLQRITEDPAGADPAVVDLVLSNFRVTRRPGGPGAGPVTIVLDRLVPVTVPRGARFSANGVSFLTPAAHAARTVAGSVVAPTDRLIRAVGNGEYAFTVDVEAEAVGVAGQLSRGTRLSPAGLIPGFLRAYAESDFTGGADADTNAELIARLAEGIADRTPANRTTASAMIRNEAAFALTVAVEVAGYGDPEQVRYHGVLPVAAGGRLDVYAQTQALPREVRVARTATLIERTAAGGVWQFSLARDDAPGFYEVAKVVQAGEDDAGQAGYEVTETVRGFDLSADGTGFLPDVTTAEEAAFTRFQTATVRFLDTDTDASVLTVGEARRDYDAIVVGLPLLAELQTFLADRGRRPPAADVLARAPVPCFLTLNFKVFKKAGEADPDLAAIAADLAAYVNGLGFVGRLAASALAAVVHGRLAAGQTTGSFDMFGRIVRPDGAVRYVRSDEALLIPDWPSKMVTARTTTFFLDPASVAVSVVTS